MMKHEDLEKLGCAHAQGLGRQMGQLEFQLGCFSDSKTYKVPHAALLSAEGPGIKP